MEKCPKCEKPLKWTYIDVLGQKIKVTECCTSDMEELVEDYGYTIPDDRDPRKLTDKEWMELFENQEVRDAWGLENETLIEFKSMVYAVHFDYVNETPGYCGDLYIIMGSAMMMPMFLTRDEYRILQVTRMGD